MTFRTLAIRERRQGEEHADWQVVSARAAVGVTAPRRTTATLAPSALSARRAREVVAAALRTADWQDPTTSDRLALVTSELVTNAVVHTGTDIELRVTVDRSSVHVEVVDGSVEPPTRTPPALSDTSGRGLMLVDALVDDWGVVRLDGARGKVVWIRIDLA